MEEDIKRIVLELTENMAEEIREQIKLSGFKLSGKLLKSVTARIEIERGEIVGIVSANKYAGYLDAGVKPERIPFSPGSGRRRSKVVEALTRYFRRRGAGSQSKRAAFATLRVWKREGMSTRASKRFSRAEGNARQGFINRAVKNKNKFVREKLEKDFEGLIVARFDNLINAR